MESKEKEPTAEKKTVVKKKKDTPVDNLRVIELGVLLLVVVSNLYFGFVLTTGAGTAKAATIDSSASTATSQLEPASVPKMVGGC